MEGEKSSIEENTLLAYLAAQIAGSWLEIWVGAKSTSLT
jgi:hypothetical protein